MKCVTERKMRIW